MRDERMGEYKSTKLPRERAERGLGGGMQYQGRCGSIRSVEGQSSGDIGGKAAVVEIEQALLIKQSTEIAQRHWSHVHSVHAVSFICRTQFAFSLFRPMRTLPSYMATRVPVGSPNYSPTPSQIHFSIISLFQPSFVRPGHSSPCGRLEKKDSNLLFEKRVYS